MDLWIFLHHLGLHHVVASITGTQYERKPENLYIYINICFHMIQICKEETHLHMIDTLGGVQTAGSL